MGRARIAFFMSDILGDYLKTIGRIPLLSDQEELHHGRLIRSWLDQPQPSRSIERQGRRALERMVNANLRLVVSVVSKYRRRIRGNCIDMMDLIQAGNLGLIRAVEKFDPSRGYRFSTYGYWWIRQAVTRFIHEYNYSIRVPHSLLSLAVKMSHLQVANGGPLSIQDAKRLTGEDEKRISQASLLLFYNSMVSLDQCVSGPESGELTLKDTIASPENNVMTDDYVWLERYLAQLSPLEIQVLNLRFSDERRLSLVDVSRLTGKTRHHIQAVEGRALGKLRRCVVPALNPR
jgi:RNA polymerase sigma factor (sigma-70 family)